MKNLKLLLVFIILSNVINSQNYFLENYKPYNNSILSPEEFLGYEIGFQHTRHDQIVSYLTYLSTVSNKADLIKNSNLNLVMNQSSFSYANELCKAKFRNKILGSFIEDSIFNIDYKYLNTSTILIRKLMSLSKNLKGNSFCIL